MPHRHPQPLSKPFPFRHYDAPFNAQVLRRRDEQLDANRLTDAVSDTRWQADGATQDEAA